MYTAQIFPYIVDLSQWVPRVPNGWPLLLYLSLKIIFIYVQANIYVYIIYIYWLVHK